VNSDSALGAAGSGNGTAFSATADNAFIGLNGGRVINEEVTVRGGGLRTGAGQIRGTGFTNTWAGNLLLDGNSANEGFDLPSIGASSGTLVVSGVISGSSNSSTPSGQNSWGKIGTGTDVLRNANTYIGFTRVINGALEVQ